MKLMKTMTRRFPYFCDLFSSFPPGSFSPRTSTASLTVESGICGRRTWTSIARTSKENQSLTTSKTSERTRSHMTTKIMWRWRYDNISRSNPTRMGQRGSNFSSRPHLQPIPSRRLLDHFRSYSSPSNKRSRAVNVLSQCSLDILFGSQKGVGGNF